MTETIVGARVGIYAGAFNPVHAGHIAFALQSLEAADLDMVYFLPERRPRHQAQVEHFGHRVAMLQRAVKPHRQLGVLELVDVSFTVQRTLPELQAHFPGAQLVLLMGSDVVPNVPEWPHSSQLLRQTELVVGIRATKARADLKQIVTGWTTPPHSLTMFDSYAPDVSSSIIRDALRRRQSTAGLLSSVERYSNRHWLYVSITCV